MNAYALGQMDAVRSFLKEADYADALANGWGKVAPKETPSTLRMLGQMGGGFAGYHAAESAGKHLNLDQFGRSVGEVVGAGLGAASGSSAADAAYQGLVKNRRAAGIRKVAPKAALALGATATAAALAHHLLSKNDE
jgi:hypothetical protein